MSKRRWFRTAGSPEVTPLERAIAEVPGEDDVDDVLGRPPRRRDRVGKRYRAFEGKVLLDP